jgi:hypothetical protein
MKISLVFIMSMILSFHAIGQDSYKVKSGGGVNMRQGPDKGTVVLTSIPGGANVRVVDDGNEDWYKVNYQGQTGYVSSSLLVKDNHQSSSAASNKTASSSQSPKSNSSTQSQNSSRQGIQKRTYSSGRSNSSRHSYDWGLGLRIGVPTGITAKRYLKWPAALEFSLGSAHNYYGDRYYRRRYEYSPYYGKYRYAGYYGGTSTVLQVHYLIHKPLPEFQGLNLYYGLGPQMRMNSVWYRLHGERDRRVTFVDFGLDGVFGLEYTFDDLPIAVFFDVNLYVEVFQSPFYMMGQGAIGVRYNF